MQNRLMQLEETSCGEELARDAEVPELLGELWEHVATNMVAHAKWVGTATPEAAAEHDALSYIAREYRSVAAAAERAAALMKSLHGLPPAAHDPSRLDRVAQARFVRRKIELQQKLAELLLSHARTSQTALMELELRVED
jgi:hypothetical protein